MRWAKRKLLSLTNITFDSLGFECPATLQTKMLMRTTRSDNMRLDSDDLLPEVVWEMESRCVESRRY